MITTQHLTSVQCPGLDFSPGWISDGMWVMKERNVNLMLQQLQAFDLIMQHNYHVSYTRCHVANWHKLATDTESQFYQLQNHHAPHFCKNCKNIKILIFQRTNQPGTVSDVNYILASIICSNNVHLCRSLNRLKINNPHQGFLCSAQ